jgi:hypothetical protein
LQTPILKFCLFAPEFQLTTPRRPGHDTPHGREGDVMGEILE